ncbi:MAG: Lrp/AsnC family transcriptional regulator [Pseudomonadota bacterium]
MTALDQIDRNILRVLSEDGRISNLALADRVGLSPSACLRRTQELERTGLIKGYRAVLDAAKLGVGFTAYVAVGLNDHTKASQEAFERAISRSDEVIECHNITGTVEYLLRVECADIHAYKAFHTDALGTLPQVNAITSYIVMGSPKDLRA